MIPTSKKPREDKETERLHPDTKKSILAISLFGIGLILILSSIGKAGPVGEATYSWLSKVFGIGYHILPTIFIIVAVSLLFSKERRFLGITLIGIVIVIAAGLGLLDIITPGKAGFAGNVLGSLEVPFGYAASIVITATIAIGGLLTALNKRFRLTMPSFLKRKEKEEDEVPEPKIIMPGEAIEKEEIKDEKEEPAAPEEKEDKEKETPIKTSGGEKVKIKKFKNYVAQPFDMLVTATEKPGAGDLRANANIIKRTLESFGIQVEMGEITIGPKVTRYTLKPAEGVKLARITALNQDLALALAAHPISIEAPIPGKSLVGIEIPNKTASIVRLGNMITYGEFLNSGQLGFPLGRDVGGDPIMARIDKMPHLLIAGTTGSGKSIAIHSLIVSLLFKNSPETLKLVLIDPKRVELSIYEGIPHLVTSVVNENKKAIGVLKWAIQEMERRYETLLKAGARDIGSYNGKQKDNIMPYHVIVIDELADLMASYGREVEGSIVRLAQMARATGIHLVVSTQRPSVEVITGLIKANITSRVALQVASQVDSRTILDMAGAEKLLGGGDMLFVSGELSKPKRIQGAYISDEEISNIVDFIIDNNPVSESIDEETEATIEKSSSNSRGIEEYIENDDAGDDDELFDEAVKIVSEAGKASASLLQRRLRIGYARAARLLDIMESKGLIGPGEGAKPRDVFITKDNGKTAEY